MATGFVCLIGNTVVFTAVSLVTKPVDAAVLDEMWGTVYERRVRDVGVASIVAGDHLKFMAGMGMHSRYDW